MVLFQMTIPYDVNMVVWDDSNIHSETNMVLFQMTVSYDVNMVV